MPYYTYKPKCASLDEENLFIELFQKIDEPVLKYCPETGVEIEKIITSPPGVKLRGMKRSLTLNKKSPASTPCKCVKHDHHHKHH